MKQYQELLRTTLEQGEYKNNRTGVGTYSVFGHQMRFNMNDGFPIVTTKAIHWPSVVHELIWFISGKTNTKYLTDNGVRIWNEWALSNGDLGPVYGEQWRRWKDYRIGDYADIGAELEIDPEKIGYKWLAHLSDKEGIQTDCGLYFREIDQLQECINLLRNNPNSRRIITSAWNPSVLPDESISPQENVMLERMALAPCHTFFQFYHINGKLSLKLTQRSCDIFLGVPFNISSYALLLHMVARITGLEPFELIWSGGDIHLYENHVEQARVQLERDCLGLPSIGLNPDCKEIDDFTYDDIQLINYNHHERLAGKVAI